MILYICINLSSRNEEHSPVDEAFEDQALGPGSTCIDIDATLWRGSVVYEGEKL